MRVVFPAIASLLFGIDSVVDAHPAKSSQPTQSPSKTVPIKYPTAASTTGALESGSRNNGLNALTAPLYTGSVSTGIPKNGSEINGTKIYVILSTLAPIPAQATWVNEYSQSNWGNGTSLHNDTSLDNGTFPDNGTSLDNDNPPGNGTYVGVRPLQKRHLPHGSRRGQRDTYRNRRGVWLNEYYFQEDEPRNPGGPRLTIQVEDYRLESDMLALRLANRRPELDQSQFPEYVDEQIPTQRTNPAPARGNGGNVRRPNNEQLHGRLGIEYPPYANTPESRSGQNLQDEDARVQLSVYAAAPWNEPILESYDPYTLPSTPQSRADLDSRIRYYQDNTWAYDDTRPSGPRREGYYTVTRSPRRSRSPRGSKL